MTPLPPPPPLPRGVKPELHVLRHALTILSEKHYWIKGMMFMHAGSTRCGCCLVGAVRFTVEELYSAPTLRDRLEARVLARLTRALITRPDYDRENRNPGPNATLGALTFYNDKADRTLSDIQALLRTALHPRHASPHR